MATSTDEFCTLCDPSPIKATFWCPDCTKFLCDDCTGHHRKLLKAHSLFPVHRYRQLPSFIKELKVTCDEHNEQFDSYCPVHSKACCIRCVIESHRSCEGVGPLNSLVSNFKDSAAMKDIEISLKDIQYFTNSMIADRKRNKEAITVDKKSILSEIKNIRLILNSKLDKLEQEVKVKLQSNEKALHEDIDETIANLNMLDERVSDMSSDYKTVQNEVSSRQTLLSLPNFTSNIEREENQIIEWSNEGKFRQTSLVFNKSKLELSEMLEFGCIERKAENNTLKFSRRKEKQAQIIGVSSPYQSKSVSRVSKFNIKLGHKGNTITGCDIMNDETIIISQYHSSEFYDSVSHHNENGIFLQKISKRNVGSLYDVCTVDYHRLAFSSENGIFVIDMKTKKYTNRNLCADPEPSGLVHVSDSIFYCSNGEGINRYDMKTEKVSKVIEDKSVRESYITYNKGKLCYTAGNTIKCCDENGREVWKFEDKGLLWSPRGLSMDKDGFIYVLGLHSDNLVMISPDGRTAKGLNYISNPLVICYNEKKNQLLVCTDSNEGVVYNIDVQ